jgi:thioredoxin 1
MATEIKNETELDAFKGNHEISLVKFSAAWCGPCKMLTPILNGLDTLNVASVDIDEAPELATEYGVTSVPTVVFFKNGVALESIVGVQPGPKYISAAAGL